jgi:hypothetical protein
LRISHLMYPYGLFSVVQFLEFIDVGFVISLTSFIVSKEAHKLDIKDYHFAFAPSVITWFPGSRNSLHLCIRILIFHTAIALIQPPPLIPLPNHPSHIPRTPSQTNAPSFLPHTKLVRVLMRISLHFTLLHLQRKKKPSLTSLETPQFHSPPPPQCFSYCAQKYIAPPVFKACNTFKCKISSTPCSLNRPIPTPTPVPTPSPVDVLRIPLVILGVRFIAVGSSTSPESTSTRLRIETSQPSLTRGSRG